MQVPEGHPQALRQIAGSFLKLGFTAIGGPAASVAMMRQMFVVRRRWLTEEEFLDYWGITNLVPGPNATELAIHIGYKIAGWPGLIAAGVCYILPAMVIVLGLAWAYVRYGALPALDGVLYGIKPVVVAILAWALVGMVRPRVRQPLGLAVSMAVLIAYLLGASPLVLLLAGGALMGLVSMIKKGEGPPPTLSALLLGVGLPMQALAAAPFSLARLFWVFLKAGALMYGSGYVLLAFIRDDLVTRLGWLTQSQLVDAIAVGQVTPGPLSTTATFVGYLTGGLPGALLATLAMFLPGFLFVAITHPWLDKLRGSGGGSGFLDGVNFAALGLMAGVTWEVGATALVDPVTAVVALVGLFLLWRFELPAPWLILGGAVVGVGKVLCGG
ncbi:chromate efflux transporter [bacterium]|nr:chromate efflux transporter [bacterium]